MNENNKILSKHSFTSIIIIIIINNNKNRQGYILYTVRSIHFIQEKKKKKAHVYIHHFD